MRRGIVLLLAIAIMFAASAAFAADCADRQKADTLFIVGGADFHDPVKLPPIVKDLLEKTGRYSVNITQDLNELTPANIAKYSLVIDYTTGLSLTPDQEKGFTEFVANGGGFVGIHSATDSFKNSDAYWKMIGGRFTGHSYGTFKVKITGKSHAIVQGIDEFQITDETYCDAFHPESKVIVLMRRVDDDEPAAWVQYYGKGRVFATGLGHGEPAWKNPAFQKMILQASDWATGKLNP